MDIMLVRRSRFYYAAEVTTKTAYAVVGQIRFGNLLFLTHCQFKYMDIVI